MDRNISIILYFNLDLSKEWNLMCLLNFNYQLFLHTFTITEARAPLSVQLQQSDL